MKLQTLHVMAGLYPAVKIDEDVLRNVIESEALKREIFDGDEAKAAQEELKRAARAAKRQKAKAAGVDAVKPASVVPAA